MDGLNINFKRSLLFKSGRNWVGRGLLTSTNWCSEWALQTNLVSVHWFTGWFWENPLSIWFLDGINISFFPINWSLECIIYGISSILYPCDWKYLNSNTYSSGLENLLDWLRDFWTDTVTRDECTSMGGADRWAQTDGVTQQFWHSKTCFRSLVRVWI